ncbi:glycosyltransferase family 2 protein [Usitatibacter palustris]|uniref:Glycosyltransferase 2-like domain-containing protein n=1 Tax=Usitatibacter palustris TaxID=2732487 RepID=A0A6M4H2I0_9PROT|nr:glycosyltransferase family 2 protein [Usitatibacter palustris]QJR13670.1 hypothetical protein DSM104440_00456 [Usitatibacter palustris]
MSTPPPLVSILIPAYNERFFAEAFTSARAQTYRNIEIVVSDDSPGTVIETIVREAADARVRYLRNATRLGFDANFTQCFDLALGEHIKFLNDDDRLRPACVEMLSSVLASHPAVNLATSRRVVIDEQGRAQPDVVATTPISHVSGLFSGWELGNFALANSVNFIGEPTTVLFRRSALKLEDAHLFRWGGRDYHCLADLSVWLRLLAGGLAYYASATLSEYRIHGAQEQRKGDVGLSCLTERLWIARRARDAGFLASPGLYLAALGSVTRRCEAWLATGAASEADRVTLEQLLAEVAAEARATESAHARDSA